jgi:hypothetical protein
MLPPLEKISPLMAAIARDRVSSLRGSALSLAGKGLTLCPSVGWRLRADSGHRLSGWRPAGFDPKAGRSGRAMASRVIARYCSLMGQGRWLVSERR